GREEQCCRGGLSRIGVIGVAAERAGGAHTVVVGGGGVQATVGVGGDIGADRRDLREGHVIGRLLNLEPVLSAGVICPRQVDLDGGGRGRGEVAGGDQRG